MRKFIAVVLGFVFLGPMIGCEQGATVTQPNEIPPPPSAEATQEAQSTALPGGKKLGQEPAQDR